LNAFGWLLKMIECSSNGRVGRFFKLIIHQWGQIYCIFADYWSAPQ
jgi:hypothetical protein